MNLKSHLSNWTYYLTTQCAEQCAKFLTYLLLGKDHHLLKYTLEAVIQMADTFTLVFVPF